VIHRRFSPDPASSADVPTYGDGASALIRTDSPPGPKQLSPYRTQYLPPPLLVLPEEQPPRTLKRGGAEIVTQR